MRILAALDGSPCSDKVIDELLLRPWPPDSPVKLITAVEPAMPGSRILTCFMPLESPAHADMSWKYAVDWLRGKCLG